MDAEARGLAVAREVLEAWVNGYTDRNERRVGRYWRGTGRPRDAFTLTPREARDWVHDHGPGGWGGVMFHGTSSPAAAAIRAEGFNGHAWTASDIEFAVGYADAETTNNVQRVAIRLERPYVTARQGGIGREEIMAFDRRHPALEYTHALAAEGYDGLVEIGPDGVTRLVVAFQPEEQVRIIASAEDDLEEAADSMRKATTPKRGLERKRGGPNNWVERSGVRQPGGRGLPPYIQHIALALKREKGMPTGRAIATAVNAVKRWARGGGDVDAGTRSAASLALSQWIAMKARSKAGRVREADLCEADLEGMALLVAATILEADQSD